MASSDTRRLGNICRVYKNSDNKVIALEDVEVVINVQRIRQDLFYRGVDKINVHKTLLHLGGSNRVVALVQTIGNYDSVEENAGNYFVCKWIATDNSNDVIISLEQNVLKLGDST